MDKKGGSTSSAFHDSSKEAVDILNSILEPANPRQVSEPQIILILDALASAQDPALVLRFPAVLALCARRDIELDSQKLLGRYWESSAKRQNLEMLLFISAVLFRRLAISAPRALPQIADSLRNRHARLASAKKIQLAGGPSVAVHDLAAVLKHAAGASDPAEGEPEKPPAAAGPLRSWSSNLSSRLNLLFSEKQKELVLKRLRGQPMTKTEREYFSRVVKKKLAAIADAEMQEVAALLTGSGGRSSAGTPGR